MYAMENPMTSSLAFLVLSAPLACLAVAAVALAHPGSRSAMVEKVGTAATWYGVVVAIVAGAFVARNGLIGSPTVGWHGLGFSLRLDPLSTVMFTMIALLAIVIFRFSCTYLDGDDRHGAFLGWIAATVAAVETLVLAGNLALLVVAWIGTSLSLHRLLLFYRDRRGAVIAARKKYIAARIGDAFLIGAAVLLYRHFGTGDLERIFVGARSATSTGWTLGSVELAAAFLAMAALLKSAQFPTHGWLVEVMETPTPVSALLHAGILNAGPFLAIRMAFVLDQSHLATTLLITIGGFTALFASVVLLTQPSVKVALGYSSAAHMGFMLMVCGMGVYPAALLHLVAHSFYKAHAFLSSGSVIDETRAAKVALPRRLGNPGRVGASVVIALAWYFALAALWGVSLVSNPVVIAIGAILVLGTTQIVAPALDSTGGVGATIRASLLALGVTASFFALERGAHELLGDTVPNDGQRTAIHLIVISAVLVAFAGAVLLQILEPSRSMSTRRRTMAIHFRNGFYANAMFDRLVGSLRTPDPLPSTTSFNKNASGA